VGLAEFASTATQGSTKENSEHRVDSTSKQSLVPVGPGLAAIPKRIVDRIKTNDYVDLLDLLPARGKVKPLVQDIEGQILVVQASDLSQSRELIFDLPTWLQCFSLYAAAVLKFQQDHAAKLMAYRAQLQRPVKGTSGRHGSCTTLTLHRKWQE